MKKQAKPSKPSPKTTTETVNKPWKELIKDALAAKRPPEGWPKPKITKKGG